MHVKLDDMPVRFTPEGKLYIIDAIAALAQIHKADDVDDVWETLQKEKPQVKQYVDYHHGESDEPLPTTDSDGWGHIQDHLFDHLIETRLG